MNYYKVCITAPEKEQDIIIALLDASGFDGFEQDKFGLKTYKKEEDFDEQTLKELANQLEFTYKLKVIPSQNWNALWESNFQPIKINNFCAIRADFHPANNTVKHEIVIHPKMAFGTGHHETTYMMMSAMETIPFANKKVLDYGCGTGILAILAEKLEAAAIQAIDIDPLSYENTLENIKKNQSNGIHTLLGEIDKISDDDFDIILANINRSVIIDSLPTLFSKLQPQGCLLISGILQTDEPLVTSHIKKTGFVIVDTFSKGEWLCIKLKK